MLKGLQTSKRSVHGTDCAISATELILDEAFCPKVIEFIKDAKTEIRICAYRWFWYEANPEIGVQKLNIELLRAQLRGVKIRAICDTEQTAEAMRSRGIAAKSHELQRMMHTKAIAIDSKTLVIGSHNLTKRASQSNFEMSLATQEAAPILLFIDYFDKMW